jgi:hypothetical protein
MTGKGAKARQAAKRKLWLENYDPGFKCKGCGHSEFVHQNFVGRCCHEAFMPLDGSTCDCQKMDEIKGEK